MSKLYPPVARSSTAMPQGARWATAGMVVAVAAANYLAQFAINDWMTWGTPVIAVTFLINELTHQMYGPKMARQVVLWGFVMALGVSMGVAPWRIAIASATAFLVSQLLDIAVFARLRARPNAKLWWLSPLAASTVASAIDTFLFFFIAFAGTELTWWRLGTGDFAVKMAFDLAMLAPFRVALRRGLLAPSRPLAH
jgi:uncharacterized PurR-regulated membrane protein YhhQ (DUF165 family)